MFSEANFTQVIFILGILLSLVFFVLGYFIRKLAAERKVKTAEAKAREKANGDQLLARQSQFTGVALPDVRVRGGGVGADGSVHRHKPLGSLTNDGLPATGNVGRWESRVQLLLPHCA